MTPIKKILAKLPNAKNVGNGWLARCPAHDDQNPSLSIAEGDNGSALVHCQANCETPNVLKELGLTMADLFPSRDEHAPQPNRELKSNSKLFRTARDAIAALERRHGVMSKFWTYRNQQSEPVGAIVRWDLDDGKKDIRPVSRHKDGWRIAAMPTPCPLFNLPELGQAGRVLVVEGEKAADAAQAIGFTVTTSSGGAAAGNKTDWRPLAGKEVWILPDNDNPGRNYAESVATTLAKLTPTPVVKIVELPDLPEGGDIVDWIDGHGDAAEPDQLRKEVEELGQAAEPWQVAQEDDLAFRPFPVEALPEPVRGFVTAGAKAIVCDESYLALPLLVSLAAAIGNTRRLELKRGWCAPPILWGAIVGESGSAKTPAFKLVMKPIRERQTKAFERYEEDVKQYAADLARWEKAYAEWKKDKHASDEPPLKPQEPTCVRFVVSDTTIEALAPILLANPRGVLLSRDELAGWFGSFDRYAGKGKTGADSAHWLSMFGAETIYVDRKTGVPRTIVVPNAATSVIGCIQPAILKRALSAEHRESGLAARLLVTCPPRRSKRWTEADIDPQIEVELMALVDRLLELESTVNEYGRPQPILVKLTTEAKKVWRSYYNAHADEQADMTGDISAAWSKLEEYAARLALVIHFIRWAAKDPTLADIDILDVQSMKAGIQLTTWFKHEARRVYALFDECDTERDSRRLIEWIERQSEPVTARRVQQSCRWLKDPGAAESALEELVKSGRGTWENSPAGQPGKPTRRFKILPASTVYDNRRKSKETPNIVDVDNVDGSPPIAAQGKLFQDEDGPYQ